MHLTVFAYSLLYRKVFFPVNQGCTFIMPHWHTTKCCIVPCLYPNIPPHIMGSQLKHPTEVLCIILWVFYSDFRFFFASRQNQVFLFSFFALWAGLLFPKPKVISLLQQGEDPWKVEKESPGGTSLGEWVGNLCRQQSGKLSGCVTWRCWSGKFFWLLSAQEVVEKGCQGPHLQASSFSLILHRWLS